jgi:hypothetical protein
MHSAGRNAKLNKPTGKNNFLLTNCLLVMFTGIGLEIYTSL